VYADRNVAVRMKEDSATWRAWLITWAVCMVLRVGAVAGLGLIASYTFFSEGLRNAYWYPGYEALAKAIWTLTAGIVPIYVALHLALHSLIGPLVFSIALRLNLGRTAAWLAALGVAVMPYYVSMAARQPQAGSLIVVFAATFLAFLEWKRRGFRLLPGLAFGVLGFVLFTMRPNATVNLLLFYAVSAGFVFGAWRRGEHWRPGVTAILASGLVFTSLVAGMMAANWVTEGRLSPFPAVSGENLYIGNNRYTAAYVRRYDIDSLQDTLHEEFPAGVSPDDDASLRRSALAFMQANPLQTLENTFLKGVRYWDIRLERAERNSLYWNLAYTVPYITYGLLAIVGTALLWSRGQRFVVLLLGGTAIGFCAPHLLFHGTIRHRMTTEFLLLLLAGYALARLLDALRGGALVATIVSLGARARGWARGLVQRTARIVQAIGPRH